MRRNQRVLLSGVFSIVGLLIIAWQTAGQDPPQATLSTCVKYADPNLVPGGVTNVPKIPRGGMACTNFAACAQPADCVDEGASCWVWIAVGNPPTGHVWAQDDYPYVVRSASDITSVGTCSTSYGDTCEECLETLICWRQTCYKSKNIFNTCVTPCAVTMYFGKSAKCQGGLL